jgi:transcription antitermination protein NusB
MRPWPRAWTSPSKSWTRLNCAVLRLSTWELIKRVDVPYRVVINEGIELAKVYGSTDGHKFVNGVLDKLAPRLREAEVKAYKR